MECRSDGQGWKVAAAKAEAVGGLVEDEPGMLAGVGQVRTDDVGDVVHRAGQRVASEGSGMGR